jgi:hypothetical protein
MSRPFAKVEFHWLAPEEGGRKIPFMGPRYAPAARIAGQTELFGVVCLFANPSQSNPTKAELTLLNPDLRDIWSRIVPGSQLELTEGSKLVARCHVVSLECSRQVDDPTAISA